MCQSPGSKNILSNKPDVLPALTELTPMTRGTPDPR